MPPGNSYGSTDSEFLADVADQFFSEMCSRKKSPLCFCSRNWTLSLATANFKLFEAWLERISSWADHDALVHDLIAPMLVPKPPRAKAVFRWAKSAKR